MGCEAELAAYCLTASEASEKSSTVKARRKRGTLDASSLAGDREEYAATNDSCASAFRHIPPQRCWISKIGSSWAMGRSALNNARNCSWLTLKPSLSKARVTLCQLNSEVRLCSRIVVTNTARSYRCQSCPVIINTSASATCVSSNFVDPASWSI